MPRTVFAGVRFGCIAGAIAIASAAGLEASTVTFSPQPARAGQEVTATFTSIGGVDSENLGEMVVESIGPDRVVLRARPYDWRDYNAQASFGPLTPGTYRVEVYEFQHLRESRLLEVLAPPVCTSTATHLCLGDAHFEVTATWRDFAGNTGDAHTVPDRLGGSGDYGLLWFFAPDNPELLVKILDGCAINGRYRVFVSPGSNVEYEVTVRDVRSGTTRTYSNPLHNYHPLFADTDSFPCAVP